jgi:oligoendopeptidase F
MATTELKERDRTRIEDKYKWNIGDVYPSGDTWHSEKDRIAAALPGIRAFAGRLGSSAQVLADALDTTVGLEKELSRLYVYASMLADQDTRASGPQGMKQQMQLLFAEFSGQASYIEPEILKVGRQTIDTFLGQEPRLKIYTFYLRDIVRRAEHTLTDAEERILADAGPLAGSPSNIYGILTNADFPYPTITLANGTQKRVDHSGYGELRASAVRHDREAAMEAFFTAMGGFSRTLGTIMNSNVQRALFYSPRWKPRSTARTFPSPYTRVLLAA